MSILITGGYLVTMNPARDVIERGFIGIRDAAIAEIGTPAQQPRQAYAETIDAEGMIVLPGLINAHHHHWHNLFRGLGHRLPPAWRDHRHPHPDRALSNDDLRASARLAAIELIRTGTTCCLNYALEPFDEQAAAATIEPIRELGLRHVLAAGFHTEDAQKIGRLAADWRGPIVRIALAIETTASWLASGATSERTIKAGYALARVHDLVISTHAACDLVAPGDYAEAKRRTGRSDILHLMELGVLDARWVLAQPSEIDDTDLSLMKEAGCHAVWTPTSDAFRGCAPAPWARMARMGINCALGTDGPLFDPSVDMVEQMKASILIQNATRLDATAMSAERALEMATINGARALGWEQEIGSLEVGKRADVAVFDMREPHLQVINKPISNFVTTGRGADAHAVIIDGRIVWRDGQMLRGPRPADVAAAATQAGRRLAARVLH